MDARAARFLKRERKAREYRAVALAGGGPREIARRLKQRLKQRGVA